MSISEILAGMSYALDLTEGMRPGHSVRSCLIGMQIARTLGLDAADRDALYYALLMKDLGCSSNSARFAALFGSNDHDLKVDLKTIDWTRALESFRFVARNSAAGAFWPRRVWRLLAVLSRGEAGAREVVRTRCERGAEIATLLHLPAATADAIRALDEHWDGQGQPYGKRGHEIPFLARILGIAQTFEVYFTTHGHQTALDMVVARRGTWFEPAMVDALLATRANARFWTTLAPADKLNPLRSVAPDERSLAATEAQIDNVADAFARVIDAKSPWTFRHSLGVADIAVRIGEHFGYAPAALRSLRRAGLLHDIGKLGVSNLILDKPGKLTDAEFQTMRRHPRHTADILARVAPFATLSQAAAAHHERLDGRGYHVGLIGSDIPQMARILGVADVCDALRASRPYREGLSIERTLDIMSREVGHGTDPDCFTALRAVLDTWSAAPDDVPAARLVTGLAEDYQQAA